MCVNVTLTDLLYMCNREGVYGMNYGQVTFLSFEYALDLIDDLCCLEHPTFQAPGGFLAILLHILFNSALYIRFFNLIFLFLFFCFVLLCSVFLYVESKEAI